MSLTPFLLVLAAIAVPFALRERRWRGLLVTTAFTLVYLFSVDVEIALATAVPLVSPLLGFRGFLIFAIIGLAVLSAAGLASLARLASRLVTPALAIPATVVVALLALVFLEIPGYGPRHQLDPTFLRGRLPEMVARGQMIVQNGRKLPSGISSEIMRDNALPVVAERLSGLPGRADVSPRLGSVLKALPLTSDARTMNLYTFTLSLLHLSWSDEQQALFLENAYGVAGASVDEMSAWFGLDRVAFDARDPGLPPEDPARFRAAGWKVTDAGEVTLADASRQRMLAAFRARGVLLHIGQTKNETYRNTYRLASAGALPFEDGWLVQGPACVDDISADELARFDVVVLEDQCERDGAASDAKLSAYVQRGGRLFIETGWEFSRFASTPQLPDFLPVTDLRWQSLGVTPKLAFGDSEVSVRGLDLARFGDFRFASATWDVSAPSSSLREWSRAVVLADGRPVVAAGHLGAGRVAWSGMNLVTHARAKQSADERELYHRVMQWLLEGVTASPRELALERQSEDGASVRLPADGWLLWREPPQYATLAPEASARYSAGPGLLLVRMKAGEVRVEQHPSATMRGATILGGISTLGLLLWLVLRLARGGMGDPAGVFGATGRAVRGAATGWMGNEDA